MFGIKYSSSIWYLQPFNIRRGSCVVFLGPAASNTKAPELPSILKC